MTQGLKTIIYPVRDLEKAKALYGSLLGVEPEMDEAYYVGFEAGGQHLGLNPHGHDQGMTTAVPYWHVPDIEAALAALTGAGAAARQPVTDVGGGRLTATVVDLDGNVIGLLQDP
jgi:predicted enzyme related to lactoylglutathione lyase